MSLKAIFTEQNYYKKLYDSTKNKIIFMALKYMILTLFNIKPLFFPDFSFMFSALSFLF
jgi:hypothetical protein